MAKPTDKDKRVKKIIADRVDGLSMRQIAAKHGVSTTTVQNALKSDPALIRKITDKKEQNTQDVLAYMDNKVYSFKRFADYVFDERLNPAENREELSKAPLSQIMTAFGIGADKLLKSKELQAKQKADGKQVEDLATLAEMLKK